MQVDIKKLSKLISSKKLTLAGEMLSSFTQPLQVSIREADLATPFTGVEWVLHSGISCELIFNHSMPAERYQFFITRLLALFPLLQAFHASKYFSPGRLFINLDDSADAAGLAFCSNRDDTILIPDTDFLGTYGYRESRLDFMVNSPPWSMRKPIAFWRGTTTGVRIEEAWQALPRLNLCALANQETTSSLFDVGVSSFAQVSKKEKNEIIASGYLRAYRPMSISNQYQYQIDIDGNTNAWAALFQKLLSGSVVLKVASPGNFRQWYYDQLIPWKNFVPVRSDMSDLVEKIQWLLTHDDEAREIGINGAKLAYQLTYEQELDRALVNINKALT